MTLGIRTVVPAIILKTHHSTSLVLVFSKIARTARTVLPERGEGNILSFIIVWLVYTVMKLLLIAQRHKRRLNSLCLQQYVP